MPRQKIYPEQWSLTDKAKTLSLAHLHGNGFDPDCPWCLKPRGMKVRAWYEAMPDGVLVNEWHSLNAARAMQHCRNGAFHDLCIVIPLMESRGLLYRNMSEEALRQTSATAIAAACVQAEEAEGVKTYLLSSDEVEDFAAWQVQQEPPPGYGGSEG